MLFQTSLFQDGIGGTFIEIASMIGDRDFSRFVRMDILIVRAFYVFQNPAVSEEDFFYFPKFHRTASFFIIRIMRIPGNEETKKTAGESPCRLSDVG